MSPARPLALCAILLSLTATGHAQAPAVPLPPAAPAHRKPPTPVIRTPRDGHAIKVRDTGGEKPVPPLAPPKSAPQKTVPPKTGPSPSAAASVPPEPVAPGTNAAMFGPPEPPKGTVTGLPLPRWASLRTDEVNLRHGPGTRYPIDWVYKRRDLPVRILREFEVWRLVEDQDGIKGWVHQATLMGRRDFVVTGGQRTLRAAAQVDAAPVALLKPGVIGRIRACEAQSPWCDVQIGDYRGWLQRDEFWGTFDDEAVP
jgi:SH3-like domain-containing protein